MFSDNEEITLDLDMKLELTKAGVCSSAHKSLSHTTCFPKSTVKYDEYTKALLDSMTETEKVHMVTIQKILGYSINIMPEHIVSAAKEISKNLSESTMTGCFLKSSGSTPKHDIDYFNDLLDGRKKFN